MTNQAVCRRVFDRSRADRITSGLAIPAFTYEVFERCMTYAAAYGWGKKPVLGS